MITFSYWIDDETKKTEVWLDKIPVQGMMQASKVVYGLQGEEGHPKIPDDKLPDLIKVYGEKFGYSIVKSEHPPGEFGSLQGYFVFGDDYGRCYFYIEDAAE